jgi:hypothetical protein
MHTVDARRLPLLVRVLGVLGVAAAAACAATGILSGEGDGAGNTMNTIGSALQSMRPIAVSVAEAASAEVPSAAASAPSVQMPAGYVRGSGAGQTTARPVGRVSVRCWQDGVLIVNESRPAPAEPFSYAVKFPSRDGGGVPTYLATWATATCLIKPVNE